MKLGKILPNLLAWITGKPRIQINNWKFQSGTWVYNLWRFKDMLFWMEAERNAKGEVHEKIRAQSSSGRCRNENGESTYLVFHTWEAFFTHQETLVREFCTSLFRDYKWKKIYLPQLVTAGDSPYKMIPFGYVFAIGYVGQGAYAAAAPQDTTYDNSAAFTLTVSGSNPFLVMGQNVQAGDYISAVKWDAAGVNETMTQLKKTDAGSTGFYGWHYIYYKIAPSAGTTKRITATLSTNTFDRANATCFSGVHQTDPIESWNFAHANAATITLTMEIYNSDCWAWTWYLKDNAVSTGGTQPSGYATDTGPDAAQSYSNATLSTGTNSLQWATNTGSQRSTQLAVAFRASTTTITSLRVKVGTYTGTGGTSGTRAITGIGFQPKFVLVWSSDTSEIYPFWVTESAIRGLGTCGAFLGENAWNTTGTYDRMQSLDADGFTIAIGSSSSASFKALNKNSASFYYLALGGVDVVTDTYTGNNTDNRNITGVGFTPGLVWLMGGSRHAVFKVTATGASTDTASNMYNGADAANKIQALQSDGFQLGTSVETNENAIAYYFMAVKDGTSFLSGQYTGNGSDNRDITGPGFQPVFVFIKGTSTQNNVLRSSDHSGDLSKYYRSSGFAANYIQSFASSGFQVGTASDVNTNAATYTYFACKVPTTSTAYTQELTETITHTDTLEKTDGKVLSETITHTDTLLKMCGKFFTDTITHTDTLATLRTAYAVLTETITHTDTFIRSSLKVLTETITHTDTLVKDTSKIFSETITLTDTLLKSFARILTETITLTDTFIRDLSKVFTETITLTDTLLKQLLRIFTEEITHTDTLSRQGGKVLSEQIDLSDTFLKSISRVFEETITLSDTLIRSMSKVFTETITHTDTLVKQCGKVFEDVITLTDTIVKSFTKVLTETITLSDTFIKQSAKIFTETITLTDTLIKDWARTFSETITLSDTLVKQFTKVISEVITLTDTFIKSPVKVFTETITFTDSLVKSMARVFEETITHTDTVVRSMARSFLETITLSDVLSNQMSKVLSEVITFTDTLTMQLLSGIKKGITVLTTIANKFVLKLKVRNGTVLTKDTSKNNKQIL